MLCSVLDLCLLKSLLINFANSLNPVGPESKLFDTLLKNKEVYLKKNQPNDKSKKHATFPSMQRVITVSRTRILKKVEVNLDFFILRIYCKIISNLFSLLKDICPVERH